MTDIELIKRYVPCDKQKYAINKLNSGYPVQYIIGNVEFFDTIIKVNEKVLIPRFETEYLVEKTLQYLDSLNIRNPRILEIGTGSGCISIALKKHLSCEIDAIDISKDALDVAKLNAKLNNVDINFILADINDFKSNIKYDLIISNPPYVPYNSLVNEKIKYEPQNAIYAPDNGIYFYKVILKKIVRNLNNNYLIALEIGDQQGQFIEQLAHKYLENSFVKIEKDYNNFERYVFISNKLI